MKATEIKIVFYTDVNGCWCGKAYFVNKEGRQYQISHSAAPEMKMRESKSLITTELNRDIDEFLTQHPDFVRITQEEHLRLYKAEMQKILANN